ncbi:NUDIX hydrolase [[Clostridium] leptum]|nr:NUDIX hydrolase [[Clostridium] leptum]
MNDWIKEEIVGFEPFGRQEEVDRVRLIRMLDLFHGDVLTRENDVAHMTSSAMVFSPKMDKVLMAYHNIYQSWAWLGGHVDGEKDFLQVAEREAREESGIQNLIPMSPHAVALDILPVLQHYKRGQYVGAHLHLNVTYAFWASEEENLAVRPEENSAVGWIPLCQLEQKVTEPDMIPIYQKIIQRCKRDFDPVDLE